MGLPIFLFIVVALFVLSGIRQINQYERGVRFTLGKFTGIIQPGWRIVLPIFQTYERVDMRLTVVFGVPMEILRAIDGFIKSKS